MITKLRLVKDKKLMLGRKAKGCVAADKDKGNHCLWGFDVLLLGDGLLLFLFNWVSLWYIWMLLKVSRFVVGGRVVVFI